MVNWYIRDKIEFSVTKKTDNNKINYDKEQLKCGDE